MTPELIAILAVGATLIRHRCHHDWAAARPLARCSACRQPGPASRIPRRQPAALRTEVNGGLAEVRADNQRLRTEVRADFARVRGDLADVRKDMQALTERVSRIEGAIEGFFAGQGARERQDDAA